jgi:hypothetical protein
MRVLHRLSVILASGSKPILGIALVAFFFTASAGAPGQNPLPQNRGLNLAEILERCADYCDRLSGAALDFICRERVEETVAAIVPGHGAVAVTAGGGETTFVSGPRVLAGKKKRSVYVYDYQLVRDKQGQITETRTLTADNGQKVEEKNAPLKTQFFKYKYIVMGPIGLLSRAQQAAFDYRIVKETEIKKEPVVIIQAAPRPFTFSDLLYGRIWVRKKDASILKIEWQPESMGNYDQIEALGKQLQMKPRLSFASEYGFEKNGIRFPSRYTVEEAYTSRTWRPLVRSKTEVDYDDYKFFTVETGVVIK